MSRSEQYVPSCPVERARHVVGVFLPIIERQKAPQADDLFLLQNGIAPFEHNQSELEYENPETYAARMAVLQVSANLYDCGYNKDEIKNGRTAAEMLVCALLEA